jgi:ribosomal-protein-alanine N-acetyltransferase
MILRTERLVLRPFRADDVDAFARFTDDEAYRRHLGDDHPRSDQMVADNLDADGAWVIELEGRVVGSIFLGDELACLLDPAVHAQGIGTEAATAVICDAVDRRGFTQVTARARPSNTASVRVLSGLGFVAVGDDTYRLDGRRK